MSLQDEIKRAVGAHGLWKGRLVAAIDTGASEFLPENVSLDNKCDFGKWLYGATVMATDKANPQYEIVRKQHAEFHKLTADIMKVALAGKKDEARKLIAPDSRYAGLSTELTQAMMKWLATAK